MIYGLCSRCLSDFRHVALHNPMGLEVLKRLAKLRFIPQPVRWTTTLCRRHIDLIKLLAQALMREDSLSDDDIRALIGIPKPAHVLASTERHPELYAVACNVRRVGAD
jgi:hypothetical protein